MYLKPVINLTAGLHFQHVKSFFSTKRWNVYRFCVCSVHDSPSSSASSRITGTPRKIKYKSIQTEFGETLHVLKMYESKLFHVFKIRFSMDKVYIRLVKIIHV